ncbi:Nif3-like dinuclear metal center hexameric protein [Arsukibacterium sp.]|uniref:Nif3-like dinuclear metal center hexameric protein n=1 Tax=Arsukibacterium sp. TaxID=1977258 RepID=UPI003FA536F7
MISRDELLALLHQTLNAERIADYCPNGLQVEGKTHIQRIVTGVTASQALIDAAIAQQADAILVHHGYFWKNENPVVTGIKHRRLKALLQHDINLIAYHLPLDVHPQLGNNAQLGKMLQLEQMQPVANVSPEGVLMQGHFSAAKTLAQCTALVSQLLGRTVLAEDGGIGEISRVAWCTGGGQNYIEQAATAGAQLFITGEVSEQTIHSARELGIHFIAAGHHATERYGIKALGEWLAGQGQLDVHFIDIANPA